MNGQLAGGQHNLKGQSNGQRNGREPQTVGESTAKGILRLLHRENPSWAKGKFWVLRVGAFIENTLPSPLPSIMLQDFN